MILPLFPFPSTLYSLSRRQDKPVDSRVCFADRLSLSLLLLLLLFASQHLSFLPLGPPPISLFLPSLPHLLHLTRPGAPSSPTLEWPLRSFLQWPRKRRLTPPPPNLIPTSSNPPILPPPSRTQSLEGTPPPNPTTLHLRLYETTRTEIRREEEGRKEEGCTVLQGCEVDCLPPPPLPPINCLCQDRPPLQPCRLS